MTKVARKNVRETVSKCLELMVKGDRYESDEAKEHVEQVLQQIRTGTADDGAWAEAMSQLLGVVEETYPEKQDDGEGGEDA
jgi:polyhydroxyalkanoate synthesis regulator phasin